MTSRRDLPMNFENAVRQFIGDKAFHIADSAHDEVDFRKWLQKCTLIMENRVLAIDTTTRHRRMLMSEIGSLKDLLKTKGGGTDKEVILSLFGLVSRLLGYDGVSGKVYNEPLYYQTSGQYFTELVSWSQDQKDWFEVQQEERENTITWMCQTYSFLKQKGLNDNQIAKVLNTSEYRIKKLKNGL